MRRVTLLFGLITSLFGPAMLGSEARASFPVGVWAMPDEVVVEGAETKQPSVTIRGFMMVFITKDSGEKEGPYGGYSVPRWGDMHYTCPAGMAGVCVMEWQDIAKKIGAEDCIGWGSQDLPPGQLQPIYMDPWTVDDYPIGQGAVPGFTPCQALASAFSSKPLPPIPDGPPDFGPDAGPLPDVVFDVDVGATDGSLFDLADVGPDPDAILTEVGPDPDADADDVIQLDIPPAPDGDVGPPFDAFPPDAPDSGFWDTLEPDASPTDANPQPDDVLPDQGSVDLDTIIGVDVPDTGLGLDVDPGIDDLGGDVSAPPDATPDVLATPDGDAATAEPGGDAATADPGGDATADPGAEAGPEAGDSSGGCGGAPTPSSLWFAALALAALAATRRRRVA
ncbi:MAG: hypothetical protein H6744_05605 [Deltaproteobacteria bacterium]|nr:hypothetical protein [Deltaproteobacteria bacterium]